MNLAQQECDQVKLDFSQPLTREHFSEIERHSKFDKQDLENYYDSVALNYDGVYLTAGYPDPQKVAEFAARIANMRGMDIPNLKVLDFGCGTGLVGQNLHENGFRKISGIDASQGMLNQAKGKGVYEHLEKVLLC